MMKRYIIVLLLAIITVSMPVFAQSTDMDAFHMEASYDMLLKKFVDSI